MCVSMDATHPQDATPFFTCRRRSNREPGNRSFGKNEDIQNRIPMLAKGVYPLNVVQRYHGSDFRHSFQKVYYLIWAKVDNFLKFKVKIADWYFPSKGWSDDFDLFNNACPQSAK